MKKIIISVIVMMLLVLCFTTQAFANSATVLEDENTRSILTEKQKQNSKLQEYINKYDSESYGLAAYILNVVRWYSIPVCFIGIVVGALNQYVLGTRRLDKKHKGYGMIMTFTTLLVLCQVLPLVFTIVVIGWRG